VFGQELGIGEFVCFRELVLLHPGKLRLAFSWRERKTHVSVALFVWLVLRVPSMRHVGFTWWSSDKKL